MGSAAPVRVSSGVVRASRSGVDRLFARHYWRVGRRLLGVESLPESWRGLVYDEALAQEMLDRLRLSAAYAVFAERVARGDDHEVAHVATMRALIAAGGAVAARSYSVGLVSLPSGEQLSRVGLGLFLMRWRRYALMWEQFAGVEVGFLRRHAPVEAVTAGLREGTVESVALALAIGGDPAGLATEVLPGLAGRFLVAGHREVAGRLYDAAWGRVDLDDAGRGLLENLSRWLGIDATAGAEPVAGRVRIGVFDYHHPELIRYSGNVGDHVQTLALLGNLARFQGVEFHGVEGLGEFATRLQGRVRPELRIEGPAVGVELVPVSRDFSDGDPIPEDTWLLAFGWHMHDLFKIRFGLPYHRNLSPVFVAFHLNTIAALTPEAIEYLQASGPIGCRDWTTVDLLLSAGVDAFFTGCLTSTVNGVFPDRDQVEAVEPRVVAAIDVPAGSVKAKRPVEVVTHYVADGHPAGFAEGLRAADELLETYLRRYHRIVTSRLHSYLPATSLGVPVSFRPKVPGDVRFAGLGGMEPQGESFVAMRDGIRALLAEVFGSVLAGASREEVYARWREVTAERVAEARARLAAPVDLAVVASGEGGVDLGAAVASVLGSVRRYGPHGLVDPQTVTDVAVSLDANYRHLLPVTLESVVANARGPLRINVTSRGLDEAYRGWLAAAFPQVAFTFLAFDDVDYGTISRLMRHVSVATMDRLLLPEVLPELDRITYVDIDTVTLGDVGELARIDLASHPLAARTDPDFLFSGAASWRAAGDHLDPESAYELRRLMAQSHPFDFLTFNAGVLVLDLARMRRDRFVERYVPLAVRYGLHDQDVLNAYTGAERAEFPAGWNIFPVREDIAASHLIHYAGAGKPWLDTAVPSGHLWREYAERFTTRVGGIPDFA